MPEHTFCEGCRREILPDDAFCPHCGTDNRPPENRPTPPAHTHNLSQGPFCIICGAKMLQPESAPNPDAPPKGAYLFRPYGCGPLMGAAVLLFGFFLIWMGVAGQTEDGRHSGSPLFGIVVCLLGVWAFFARFWVSVDLQNGRIHSVQGLWPFYSRNDWLISDVDSVVLDSVLVRQRYGYSREYRLHLLIHGKMVLLARSAVWNSHWGEGSELAAVIKKPFVDNSCGLNVGLGGIFPTGFW